MMRSLYALLVLGLLPLAVQGQVVVSTAGEQQEALSTKTTDGGLAPVVGVETVQVFRSTHDDPNGVKVGEGGSKWTYNHHVDMAVWKGRLYVAWTNGEKSEDEYPAHEVFATSEDGSHWSVPQELFPEGVSTSLRMYWFHAPNGRMLVIGGLRTGTERIYEATKGGLVIREVLADHTLGPVYTLQGSPDKKPAMKPVPMYTESGDKGFVEACGQLLANKPFLEQQDFGVLLGDRRMKIYEGAEKDFGRALCFFTRKDGALVAIGKKGFTTVSKDGGETWAPYGKAEGLVTGDAKVWAQPTSDGKYALVYNPNKSYRLPLVIQTSADGVTFGQMGLVNGEAPLQRYVGDRRTPGVQYTRGVSQWADDGSRKDKDMFVAYSAGKEDIWVSRIAVPVRFEETGKVEETFAAEKDPMHVANWNTYSPQWAPVRVAEGALVLKDADPYDWAQAERVFKAAPAVKVTLELVPQVAKGGELEIDLRSPGGDGRPVRLVLGDDGVLRAMDGKGVGGMKEVGRLSNGNETTVVVEADAGKGTFAVTTGGKRVEGLGFADEVGGGGRFSRIILRTGAVKGIPGRAQKTVEDDKPLEEASVFAVRSLKVE